ncbi:NAD(P)H-binding protein [soil metagenome]
MSKILLTGASGFVGSHVLPALVDGGHRVRALVRTDQACAQVQRRVASHQRHAVEFAIADVTRPETLAPALRDVEAVIHLVAVPRDYNGGKDMMRVNLGGTRNLLAAMSQAGVPRLVHMGALGVLDDPRLHFARSKAQAEEEVAASGLDWTILKPSVLWGERDGFFNLIALLVRISPGIVPVPAGATSRFQPFWVDDLARVVVEVLASPADSVGRRYELGGPAYWTYRQMTEEVIRGMGKRRVILPLPLALIKSVARVSEMLRLPFPVASDQLRQLNLDNSTALDAVPAAFGFEPRPMAANLGYLRRRVKNQQPSGTLRA